MRNIYYQVEKKARAEINPKSVVPQEYHDFFDVFSKKDSDTLSLHQKYDLKIYPKKEQKPDHAPIYKMSFKKLDAVQRYFDFHLAKKFIQISLVSYSSQVLFVKKPRREIRLCVHYR